MHGFRYLIASCVSSKWQTLLQTDMFQQMTKVNGALLTDNIHKNEKPTVVPDHPSVKCPYPRSLFWMENKCSLTSNIWSAYGLCLVKKTLEIEKSVRRESMYNSTTLKQSPSTLVYYSPDTQF